MTDNAELVALLAESVDRHLAKDDTLVTQAAAVFGAGDVDMAAQWFTYSLDQHAAKVTRIIASAAPQAPEDRAGTPELTAQTLIDNLLREVPEAATLSADELNDLLLEVLAEDED